jgi:hypothetical protein
MAFVQKESADAINPLNLLPQRARDLAPCEPKARNLRRCSEVQESYSTRQCAGMEFALEECCPASLPAVVRPAGNALSGVRVDRSDVQGRNHLS